MDGEFRDFVAGFAEPLTRLAGLLIATDPASADTTHRSVIRALGLLTAGAAGWRWLTVERALRHGRPLPVPLLVPVLALACVVLAAGLIGYPR